MYSEKEIESLIAPIVKSYSDLEEYLILDICKRLKSSKSSGTLEWKVNKLKELGALNNHNLKKISYITKINQKEIKNILEKISIKALEDDDKLYLKAFGKLPKIKKTTLDILVATQKQASEFQNILGSKAFESSKKEFKDIVEKLFLTVNTGQTDYNSALRSVVKGLADKGITGMTYKSEKGNITKFNLDTAIRQMILDSSSRTTQQMQLDRAEQVGCNLVEVSSHSGERPSHAEWSGRIYQLKGRSSKYKNFYETTHYGERSSEALGGFNCKHSFFPFIEGLNEPTFKPQPKSENERIYNLRTQQRYNERQIRKYKRQSNALNTAGDIQGSKQADIKVREWQKSQRQFLNKNKILQRDYQRERI